MVAPYIHVYVDLELVAEDKPTELSCTCYMYIHVLIHASHQSTRSYTVHVYAHVHVHVCRACAYPYACLFHPLECH